MIEPLSDEELATFGDGADVTGSAPQWQVAKLVAEIIRLHAENDRLRKALQSAVEFADEAWAKWDADEDVRVGKMLVALSGGCPGYRPETDAIHETLRLSRCQSGALVNGKDKL